MFPWREIGRLIVESVPTFFQQSQLLIIIGIVLLLVHMQYRRIADVQRRMFGVALSDPMRNTFVGLGLGLLGGCLATVFFVVLGISLVDVGIVYLWILSIVLLTVHPRFLCFAYAGGLLSLSSLIFGWPALNVSAVVGLVAILHFVESLLIWVHGAGGATPVYVRRKDGATVGGFTMQKFWPLPFVALIAFLFGEESLADATLSMPDWWPLVKPLTGAPAGQTYVYMLFPVVAALGYGDIAITDAPAVKARKTAVHLLVYSVVLMGFALLGSVAPLWQWVAALFSPLGHELVIWLGRRSQEEGAPVYDAERGAVVLGVVPDTPAAEMGLLVGDIIKTVNGFPIHSREDLQDVFTPWAVDVTVEVESVHDGTSRTLHYPGKIPPFGVILAPKKTDPAFMMLEDNYGVIFRRFGRRLRTFFARFARR